LGEIAHRPDRKVDRAIDLADPGAAFREAWRIDNGQKLQRGRAMHTVGIALAQRELHQFILETALHALPFVVKPRRR